MNKTLELFYKFLEQKNALITWETHLLTRLVKIDQTRANYFAERLGTRDWALIIGAFVWSETPEGHTYWSDLSKAWEQTLLYWNAQVLVQQGGDIGLRKKTK
jgi:hypothetical protein